MSKFLTINAEGEVLNTDMIARIVPVKNGGCVVMTKDGQQLHSEFNLHTEVDEYDTIRAVVPCTGISAVYMDEKGNSEIQPCPFVLLMSDGTLEPFLFLTNEDIQSFAGKTRSDFIGFVPQE